MTGTSIRRVVTGVLSLVIAGVFALAGYTGVLMYLAFTPGAPACGCLVPASTESSAHVAGIVRNAGLLLATLLVLYDRLPRGDSPAHDRAGFHGRILPKRIDPRSREGFTIVELLVVIAVIGVLIAITAPSLVGAREQARLSRVAASLRHLGIATVAYSTDH